MGSEFNKLVSMTTEIRPNRTATTYKNDDFPTLGRPVHRELGTIQPHDASTTMMRLSWYAPTIPIFRLQVTRYVAVGSSPSSGCQRFVFFRARTTS